MKRLAKIAVLIIADMAVLYLSNSVAFFVTNKILGIDAISDALMRFPAVFIIMAVKLGIFGAFFMYSMNVYRNLLLDAAGVTAANIVGTAASCLGFNTSLSSYYVFFIIVFVVEAFFAVITRFLIRGVGVDEYGYDEGDDEEEADLSDSAFYGTVYTGVFRDQQSEDGNLFSDQEAEPKKPEYRIGEATSPLPLFKSSTGPIQTEKPTPHNMQRKNKPRASQKSEAETIEIIEEDFLTPGQFAAMTQDLAQVETEFALDLGAEPHSNDIYSVQHPKPQYASDRAPTYVGPEMARRADQMENNLTQGENDQFFDDSEEPSFLNAFQEGEPSSLPDSDGMLMMQGIESELSETRAMLEEKEKEKEQERQAYEALKENMQSELLRSKKDREESLSLLFEALEEKESHIAQLEEQIKLSQSQGAPSRQNGLEVNALYAKEDNITDKLAQQGALDEIIDEVRTMYQAIDSKSKVLDSRSKLLEEREYMLVTKMIELDERERRLAANSGIKEEIPVESTGAMEELSKALEILDGMSEPAPALNSQLSDGPAPFVMLPPGSPQTPSQAAYVPLSPAFRQETQQPKAAEAPAAKKQPVAETPPKRFDTQPKSFDALSGRFDAKPIAKAVEIHQPSNGAQASRAPDTNPIAQQPIASKEKEPAPDAQPPTYRAGKGVPLAVTFDYGPDDLYDDDSDFDESAYILDPPIRQEAQPNAISFGNAPSISDKANEAGAVLPLEYSQLSAPKQSKEIITGAFSSFDESFYESTADEFGVFPDENAGWGTPAAKQQIAAPKPEPVESQYYSPPASDKQIAAPKANESQYYAPPAAERQSAATGPIETPFAQPAASERQAQTQRANETSFAQPAASERQAQTQRAIETSFAQPSASERQAPGQRLIETQYTPPPATERQRAIETQPAPPAASERPYGSFKEFADIIESPAEINAHSLPKSVEEPARAERHSFTGSFSISKKQPKEQLELGKPPLADETGGQQSLAAPSSQSPAQREWPAVEEGIGSDSARIPQWQKPAAPEPAESQPSPLYTQSQGRNVYRTSPKQFNQNRQPAEEPKGALPQYRRDQHTTDSFSPIAKLSQQNTQPKSPARPQEAPRQTEAPRPAETARGANPIRPAETARQSEASRPSESARKAEPIRPAESARQSDLIRPSETARQSDLIRPSETARQSDLTRPSETARQSDLTRPSESSRQSDLIRPAESSRQTEAARPAETARKAELIRPAEARRQAEHARQPEPLIQIDPLEQQAIAPKPQNRIRPEEQKPLSPSPEQSKPKSPPIIDQAAGEQKKTPNVQLENGPSEKGQPLPKKSRPDFSQLQNDKMPMTVFEFDSLSALIDEI